MKVFIQFCKPYLRWFVGGLTLFFLLSTFHGHWQEIAQVRLDRHGWSLIVLSLMVTAGAHIWSGVVWGRILAIFQVELGYHEAIAVYLRSNIAKYLPGNIWHFYGRMQRVVESGSSWGVASLSVLLEPLLLAAAAAILMVLGLGLALTQLVQSPLLSLIISLILVAVLVGIHPRFFNPVLQKVSRGKTKDHIPVRLAIYPWQPLLGELIYILWRGTGFLLLWAAIAPFNWLQIPQLLGVFSGAWLAGFIIPGAPGGMGVFEVAALALLEAIGLAEVGVGNLLTIVALMRGVSILAELLPLTVIGWRSTNTTPPSHE